MLLYTLEEPTFKTLPRKELTKKNGCVQLILHDVFEKKYSLFDFCQKIAIETKMNILRCNHLDIIFNIPCATERINVTRNRKVAITFIVDGKMLKTN